MKTKYTIASVFCWGLCLSSPGQKLATLVMKNDSFQRTDCIATANIPAITSLSDSNLAVYEMKGKARLPVKFQTENGAQGILTICVNGETRAFQHRVFELHRIRGKARPAEMTLLNKGKTIQVANGNRIVLDYHLQDVEPPAGADPLVKRSAFVHPLCTPSGFVITNSQPADHFHHMGLWYALTETTFNNEKIDFWNLYKHEGNVRCLGIVQHHSGPVFAGIATHNQYMVHPGTPKEVIALNELTEVRVVKGNDRLNIVDFTNHLSCATAYPVMINAYRYSGFGFRANAGMKKDNTVILTSEGKDRKTTDGSNARWILCKAVVEGSMHGILILSHPGNLSHPEPLRIWDENANEGRGDVFINFSPTKFIDHNLQPLSDWMLNYRIITFDYDMQAAEAELLWKDYAYPVLMTIKGK